MDNLILFKIVFQIYAPKLEAGANKIVSNLSVTLIITLELHKVKVTKTSFKYQNVQTWFYDFFMKKKMDVM